MFFLPTPALIIKLTLGCPGSQGAVFINEVVKGEGQDEEGAVTGHVHLEGNIPLVKANRLTFLSQRRLEQFPSNLWENNGHTLFELN